MAQLVLSILAACMMLAAEPPEDSRPPIGSVIEAFSSSDWRTVRKARIVLESRASEAVPVLIALAGRDERIPLQNTMDLVYPGTKYDGHGPRVRYDIDWLSVRAGWALEGITHKNFGFNEQAINESKLLAAMLEEHDAVADWRSEPCLREIFRSDATKRATEWWKATSNDWSRFQCLLEALRSEDPIRQSFAVHWLRFGKTRCEGLNRQTYEQRVRPEIERLAESNDEHLGRQAKLLLEGSTVRSYCERCGYDLSREFALAKEQRRRAIADHNAAIREAKHMMMAPELFWKLVERNPWRDIRRVWCPECCEEARQVP